MKMTPIILSGGSGTRLWPTSRKQFPKQFCDLLDKPLQTLTIERLQVYGEGLIVTSIALKILTEKNIIQNNLKISKVLYEPVGKNTAAAVALACKYLELNHRTGEIAGVFPSDSLILDHKGFDTALKTATLAAESGSVAILGIQPKTPETGFGYIQTAALDKKSSDAVEVLKFHEKPNLEKAKAFVADGNYFWNAGIFIFKVSQMIELFKQHESELWQKISGLKSDLSNLDEIYASLKSISLDYAIMEKLKPSELKCVPCDMGWSDLGSWDSLVENSPGDLVPMEVAGGGNTVFSKQKKKYGIVGAENLIIVDTADALMICKKGESQKVKELVEKFEASGDAQAKKIVSEHMFEHRPWGEFEILRDESYFKSKVIRVEAGQQISYQSHTKRSEHWIIVKGEAVVVLNDEEIQRKPGEHIFIPVGAKHRIINRTTSVVEFVEVQVGTYFGEDDIVRYQDDYGRVEA
ncbi:MAG: mannose-1-phosphate guanylyltransferase/mannose-6-phosphate isomerase [Bdellovibrionaceae bacterium]|nr:mannose-1-phosphate guanylyltransferase/mannose-6-phosphate isomerase [Pseudobdellovibrionaceae bacterium]